MIGKRIVVLCALLFMLFTGGCNRSENGSIGASGIELPSHIGVSPQGLIVFVGVGDGGSDLYLLNPATGKTSRVTKTLDYEQTPAFDPTGKLIVYVASSEPGGPNHIFIQPVAGGPRRQITTGNSTCDLGPHFSSDGKKLVFARARSTKPYVSGGYVWLNWSVYESDITGNSLRCLTNISYREVADPYFGTKTRVLFVGESNTTLDWNIYDVDTAGVSKTPRKLTSGSTLGCSADGKRMVFSDDRAEPYEYEIWIASIDGTQSKQLTHLRPYTISPVFDNFRQRILFLSDPGADGYRRADGPELWQIDMHSGRVSRLYGSSLFRDPMGISKP